MANPNLLESESELESLLRSAKTVVVLGAKGESEPESPAYEIPGVLKARGIAIVPVNPKLTDAHGERAWPSLANVPVRADIVDVFRRSEAIPEIADEILKLDPAMRPGAVWLQSGIRNDAAAEKLAAAGIRVVQDKCIGVYAARYLPKSA